MRPRYLLGLVLLVALAPAAYAGYGNDDDGCHGANQEECRPDPQPSHGKDCEEHGNGGISDDHCGGGPIHTGTPEPDASPTPSEEPAVEPDPEPSTTPTPTPAEPGPSPSPSGTPDTSVGSPQPDPGSGPTVDGPPDVERPVVRALPRTGARAGFALSGLALILSGLAIRRRV